MLEKDKVEGEVPSGYWRVSTEATNYLVGRIATLLDAILSDERQVKAAKDMAKTLIWESKHELDRAVGHLYLEENS